jgi:hypothetical protein
MEKAKGKLDEATEAARAYVHAAELSAERTARLNKQGTVLPAQEMDKPGMMGSIAGGVERAAEAVEAAAKKAKESAGKR